MLRSGARRCGSSSAGGPAPSLCKVGTLYGLAKVLELDIAEVMERAAQEDRGLIKTLEWAKEHM